MKKLLLLIGFIGVFALVTPTHAQEVIKSFDTTITVQSDSTITVVEQIQYDFGNAQRHGIYRDIPVKYQARGGTYKLRLSGISVADENGAVYSFSTSRQGSNLRIKIGDANQLVTGAHTYVIQYSVGRAINYFSDHDELYWNATGNGWQVPIEQAAVHVRTPFVPEASVRTACFSGLTGSTALCNGSLSSLGTTETLYDATAVNPQPAEGMTVVIGLPKGILFEPSFAQKAWETFLDNGILLLPLLVFIFMFMRWWRRGRDPKGRGTIIAEYEAPDNLTPSEVGTLVDEKVDNWDISAEMIQLAVLGFMRITRVENSKLLGTSVDYVLDKLKEPDATLQPHQILLLTALFSETVQSAKDAFNLFMRFVNDPAARTQMMQTNNPDATLATVAATMKPTKSQVTLSDLKYVWHGNYVMLQNTLYKDIVARGYVNGNPQAIRGGYVAAGIAVGFILGIPLSGIWSPIAGFSFILSGIIVAIIGYAMPARTAAGVAATEKILGLKLYMTVAEKDRINFHNAPEKSPQHFEKLLPYAMALKVESAWANQFAGIYTTPPSWYRDPHMSGFNSMLLATQLNHFTNTTHQTLAAVQSSAAGGGSGFGGGGFSGGGFGGGGGGSW